MKKIPKLYQNFQRVFFEKQNFALIYISCLILRSVFFLQNYMELPCKICMFWGLLIIIHDLFVRKSIIIKVHGSCIPYLLCIVFAISILLNYKYALYGGIKNFLYCALYFFVLFGIEKGTSDKKYFYRNNNFFIILNFLITTVSILTFCFGIQFMYQVNNDLYRVGFWFNRLNGISNVNMATIYGMMSLVLCAVNYYLKNKQIGKIKYFYILNFVIQFIYYTLSGSRAVEVCYAIILAAILAFIVYPSLKTKKNAVISLVSIISIFILVAVTVSFAKMGCQLLMKNIPSAIEQLIDRGDGQNSFIDDKLNDHENSFDKDEIDFSRVENFEDGGDITNNRMNMWQAAAKIIKQKFFFGTAYADPFSSDGSLNGNIDASVFTDEDLAALKSAGFYFHNGYIQILLCGGFIFLIFFLVFGITVLIKYVKYLFTHKENSNQYKVFVLICSILFAMLIDNLVEVHLLFGGQDGITSEFWYLLGMGYCVISECSMHDRRHKTDKKLDFLIMYEVKPRELESIVLLGDELKRRGYSVDYLSFENVNLKKILQNKKCINKYFDNVKVAIMPSLYHDMELYHIVYYVCGKCEKIVNLRWEQSFTVKDEKELDNYYYPHGDAKKGYHVCWGKASYDNMQKAGVEESKLLLTGPLQMDFLRPEFKGYYYSKEELFGKYNIPLDKLTVLYISSFAIASMTERQIELDEQTAGQSLYGDYLAFQKESQEKTLLWIEELLKLNNCYFIYRPHPVENVMDNLKYLEEKYENFKVISDFSVKQWILTCDKLTTWMSTSVAEAFFAGKNSLIVRPIPFEKDDEVTLYKNAKIIDSKRQFIESIGNEVEQSISGDIIHYYYNVTETPAFIRLSDSLEEIYKNEADAFLWDEQKIRDFESKKGSFIVQSVLIYGYIPMLRFLGKLRVKRGFSFGGKINNRVDSYQKAQLSRHTKIAEPEEFVEVSDKIKSVLTNSICDERG